MYKLENNQQIPNTIQRVGGYEGYNIAYVDDATGEKEYLEGLHYTIFPTTEIALGYKFAWVQKRNSISVKVGDNLNTVDWQLDSITESLEAKRDNEGDNVYKISYDLTNEDQTNGMEFLKTYNKLVLDDVYDKRLNKATGHKSKLELASWDQQRKEAEDYTANNSASTPLLTKLAEARGITIAQMVTTVNEAIINYYVEIAILLAKKQTVENEIRACTSLMELHVVNAHRFGFYMNEDWIIEAGHDPATFDNAKIDL